MNPHDAQPSQDPQENRFARTLADLYQRSAYPGIVHQFAQPQHLSAIGRLYGLATPPPSQARVLDIGCGGGSSLLATAESLPHSFCLGIDLAPNHIELAQQQARRRGLTNARFERADLMDWEPPGERFDYIIAHGMLSWIPEAVRRRLWSVIKDALSPGGVALVSFNCRPGWSTTEALVKAFLANRAALSQDRRSAAGSLHDELLAWGRCMGQCLEAMGDRSRIQDLWAHLIQLRQKARRGSEVLIHDELGPVSEPFYLTDVNASAESVGLGYLGDASIGLDWLRAAPRSARQAMAQAGMSRLAALQQADVLRGNQFRWSLWKHAQAPSSQQPNPLALSQLWVQSGLKPIGDRHPDRPGAFALGHLAWFGWPIHELADDLTDGMSRRTLTDSSPPQGYTTQGRPSEADFCVLVPDPLCEAFLRRLIDLTQPSNEGFQRFEDVWAQAVADVGGLGDEAEPDARRRVGLALLNACALQQAEVSDGPPSPSPGLTG